MYKEQYPKGKTAVFSSWTDNRTKLIGEGLSQTGNFLLDYKADGFELDTVKFPHDKSREFMHKIDEQVTTEAVASIEKSAPDLSWTYLEYTDDMGHMYGDSPQFYSAVEKMDNQIGRIWSAIQLRQKKYGEDWLIFVTTDHGRDEKTGKGHGGQTDRQRTTWMVTNLKSLNTYARYSKPAIVDILPTLARHLGVTIPKEKEIDGVPLEGPVSLAHPKAVFIQNTIDVSWQVYDERGMARIWLATTNNLKNAAKDEYKLVGEVPVKQGYMLIDLKDYPSHFYKILIEGPYNTVNRWVVLNDNSEKK